MSDHIFTYTPVTGSPSTLTFNTSARLVEDSETIKFNDEYAETKGGSDQTREYGDTKSHFNFTFIFHRSHASLTDLADVKTFFGVVKRLYEFVWTDESGVQRTVRCLTNPITFEPTASGLYYRCTIELKEQ